MSLHLIPERQAFVPPCCCSCYDINIPLLNTDLWLPQAPLFLFVHSAISVQPQGFSSLTVVSFNS